MKYCPSYFAVIPAAGKGERYSAGKNIVKQHVDLNGKSILEWSIEPFVNHKHIRGVLVVLSPEDPHIHTLKKNNPNGKLRIISSGGEISQEAEWGITSRFTPAASAGLACIRRLSPCFVLEQQISAHSVHTIR